jgi:hypothetical protein
MKRLLAILATLGLVTTALAQAAPKTIEQQLVGKTYIERSNVKGKAIANTVRKGEFTDQGIKIDIQGIKEIEGGVEVFAKAWKNGKQLGFGKDGSVEIERFRFYNPPIMVDDPNGKVVREWEEEKPDGSKVAKQRKLREDPEQALKESLAHTISLVGKEDTKIVKGKTGRTTSTFYPAAGANEPVDGAVAYADTGSWDTVHDAATGTDTYLSTSGFVGVHQLEGSDYGIFRGITLFGTTISEGDTISSATISLYITAVLNTDDDGQDYATVVDASPASTSAITTADYDQVGATNNPTKLSNDVDYNTLSTNAFNAWTLNAAGIAKIVDGISKFGFREGHDQEDVPVAGGTGNRFTWTTADETGTTSDPKLVVEHEAAAVGSHVPQQVILF